MKIRNAQCLMQMAHKSKVMSDAQHTNPQLRTLPDHINILHPPHSEPQDGAVIKE